MKPAVVLRPVTIENWEEVAALRLLPGQKHLFAPNWYSLLQAQFEGGAVYAINSGNTVVGFIYVILNPSNQTAQILRFMIDADFQGFGFGREALRILIEHLAQEPAIGTVWLTVSPMNIGAVKLFEDAGFLPTGEEDFDEAVYVLRLR